MIATDSVSLATAPGRNFDAYLARPHAGSAPGILILTEMFGVNAPMRALAEQYAERGFAVLVPNLFWRSDNPHALAYEGAEREIAWARLKTFDHDAAGTDIGTAAAWLRGQPFSTGKVAAIGFCAGGRMAFLAASRGKVDGAVALYALGISRHLAEIDQVGCAMQIHYGLRDQHVPHEEIEKVAAAAHKNPAIEIFRYAEAGHSFFNPVRPAYDPAAAALAAERIGHLLARMR
jgi:carboxymethylenebutenolidase